VTRKRALVTGCAGFIGSHVCERLMADGWHVTGVDNFDPWYDPALKRANISAWRADDFRLVETDIRDLPALRGHLAGGYDAVVHLAAKAGVRPSIREPELYEDVNVRGTRNLLDIAREHGVPCFVFASTSSVYGVNPNLPWREDDAALRPISPYASTKATGELLGHIYSHLYGMRFLALRFFNVYGPRQRPEAAVHRFARAIVDGKEAPIFGDGSSRRDYVWVGDIAAGVRAAVDHAGAAYEVMNLGSGRDVSVLELIAALETATGRRARLRHYPDQPGDVHRTGGDISKARRLLNYEPRVALEDGLREFTAWMRRRQATTATG